MQSNRERYESEIETQVSRWSARLGVLKARADRSGATAGVELHKRVEELRALQESARRHLQEFGAMSAGKWKIAQSGHQASWNKLSDAVEAAWRRVK